MKEVGVIYVFVFLLGYYVGIFNKDIIVDFFYSVVFKFFILLFVYNFFGVVNGVDFDFDIIFCIVVYFCVVGVKLMCGNIGKFVCFVVDILKVCNGKYDFFVVGGSVDFVF